MGRRCLLCFMGGKTDQHRMRERSYRQESGEISVFSSCAVRLPAWTLVSQCLKP